MEPVLESSATSLLQYGVLGVITIAFAIVIWALWKQNNSERRELLSQITTLQDARIEDSKKVQDTLLEVTRQGTSALHAATAAIEAMRETLSDTKTTLKELGDELRSRGRAR